MFKSNRIQENINEQNVGVSQSESEEQSVQQIKFQTNLKKEFRQKKLSLVEDHVDFLNETIERKEENIFIYLVNLMMPIILTVLAVNVFMDIEAERHIKAPIFIGLTIFGAIFSFFSCIKIAPSWRQLLKIYFMVDSMLPIIICGTIAFYYMMDFLGFAIWQDKLYGFGFPIWTTYVSGNIRVHIRYVRWKKWQVICLKLSIVFCGLGMFYIGMKYMNGAYKITQGFLLEVQKQLRDLIILFIFGAVQLFFSIYRKLTDFDQTDQLLYNYGFVEKIDRSAKEASMMEYQRIKRQSLQEQMSKYFNFELEPIQRLKSKKKIEKNRKQ